MINSVESDGTRAGTKLYSFTRHGVSPYRVRFLLWDLTIRYSSLRVGYMSLWTTTKSCRYDGHHDCASRLSPMHTDLRASLTGENFTMSVVREALDREAYANKTMRHP